ncbi:divalent-cation tolerance protein CutA [Candidatus Micrarchaeota archaeon]|nr:divalent-cation tolerance protein CutA [Candidatus Micrarchaeota archaeon]
MQRDFCQVLISATSSEEANQISDALVKRKLVAGSLMTHGPSRYWWNGRVVEKEYYNIQAFSMLRNKQEIISTIKKIHGDACPIIAFFEIDGNDEFLKWIEESAI